MIREERVLKSDYKKYLYFKPIKFLSKHDLIFNMIYFTWINHLIDLIDFERELVCLYKEMIERFVILKCTKKEKIWVKKLCVCAQGIYTILSTLRRCW